jgi:hypothetical protein
MAASIQIGKGELILAGGAALLALYIYNDAKNAAAAIGSKATSAAGYVADKVNPIKQENAVNSVIESTGQAISTNKDWTLGGWLYDLTAPDTSKDPAYQSGKLDPKPVPTAGAKR